MSFEVISTFGRDLVISRPNINPFNVTILIQFLQKPPQRFLTEGDTFHPHIFINRSGGKSQIGFVEKGKYAPFPGLLRHRKSVESYNIYSHRRGPNGKISFQIRRSLPEWGDMWTSFIIKGVIGKITTANRSQGATEGRNQNGPEWDRVCGRAVPMKEPHDRGCINARHPQKHTESTYEQRGQTEVAAA